ncbi:MAG: gliding motility protein GldL [Cytophagales bacterium]|nr:gliding motility protein GldL [Cytophagales bacterium]
MSKRGGFQELFFSTIMPKVYGIGAAVVIVGAMFKLLHIAGAGVMLGVGLSTEAIIFFLSAFEPKKAEPDWTKVYPELAEDYEGAVGARAVKNKPQESVSKKLDTMLESAKIGPELVDSLGKGMRRLSETTSRLGQLGDAAGVTNEYSNSVKAAAVNINKMNQSYAESVGSMVEMAQVSKAATAEMANASKDSKEYHSQVQSVTKNLGALNAVYEMELQDANQHIKAMNKFYSNLTTSLDSMAKATEDAEHFKGEINKLTTNLSKLNNIYGGMINAMKGSQA